MTASSPVGPPATSGVPTDLRRSPAAAARRWAARRDLVSNAVLGDGSLLLTISRRGEVEQLWWPHVDRDPHLGELRLAAVGTDAATWLDDPRLAHVQRYEPDTDILITEVSGAGSSTVTITDVVDPAVPVLARCVTGLDGRLGVLVRPELGGTDRAGGVHVEPGGDVVVCYRRDRVLAFGIDRPADAGTASHGRGGLLVDALTAGGPHDHGPLHGQVGGTVLARVPQPGPRAQVTLAVALAHTPEVAVRRVRDTLAEGAVAIAERRRAADAATLALAGPTLVSGAAARLDRRSHLVLSRLADRATGGVLAAPECDPDFQVSGGYGYVWPRDLAFIVLAHLASGRHDLAVPALRWLVRAQAPDGLWLQRHWTDTLLAPSWGTQIDETGAPLVVYDLAWHVLEDDELEWSLWPSAARGADALVRSLDPATGLPAPSRDLWEERVGVHTYTAAAVAAGLFAAARMARRHEPSRAPTWEAAAARVRTGIETQLWSEEHGRFLRARDVAREDAAGAPVPPGYGRLGHPLPRTASVDPVDATIDVSLLGLTYPFGLFAGDDPRMAATIAAIERELRTADGGLLRFPDDDYLGGNPWVLATLWLGLARRAPGASEPAEGIDYAVHARTSTDLLPEQVDVDTGAPVWVVPLTWSHAMYVLAVRPDPPGLPGRSGFVPR